MPHSKIIVIHKYMCVCMYKYISTVTAFFNIMSNMTVNIFQTQMKTSTCTRHLERYFSSQSLRISKLAKHTKIPFEKLFHFIFSGIGLRLPSVHSQTFACLSGKHMFTLHYFLNVLFPVYSLCAVIYTY